MKKVIIVHGYGGSPEINWFPWLQAELEKEGAEVDVPQMPHTAAPRLTEWLPHLQKTVGVPTADTYLVGHSLGCITILRYLETLPVGTQVGGIVLVAGFAEPISLTELNNFFVTELDDEHIKQAAKQIVLINSDDDGFVPLWQGKKMAKRFSGKLIVLNNAGHINEKTGFTQLPIVISELQSMETAMPSIVAGVVIKQDDKYLLVQEKQPKAYGLWNFPAGKVDKGETIEQAAVREAKEEVGYEVELLKKLGIFQANTKASPKHAFEARIISGGLKFPDDEILDARWFSFAEIEAMKDKLRDEWVLEAITILEN